MSSSSMWRRLSVQMREEVTSGDNLYYTAKNLELGPGQKPTLRQAIRNYFHYTGPHYTVYTFTVESAQRALITAA